jgi:hypothetical protein
MLSHRLPVLGLVSRYPTNYLIGRKTLPRHPKTFSDPSCGGTGYGVLAHLSMGYPPPEVRFLTCYSAVCHYRCGPKPTETVRLACIKRAASVRPEPGSNSLLIKNLPSTIQLLRYDRHAILRSVNIHYTSAHIYVNGIGWKMLHGEWLFEW